MKVKCLVIDDEALARKGLQAYIDKTPNLVSVGSFGAAQKALLFLKEQYVDLIFLDIQMPEMTGLEFLKVLPNPPQVIFTTAHREFAVEGFELNAVDYLLKPISYHRFLAATQKIALSIPIQETPQEHVFIKCNGGLVKIFFKEILFVETAKDYVFIHTFQKKYLTLVSLRQLQESLPVSQFIKVHRSYVVALQHVTKIEGNLLYIGQHKITISRQLKNKVYEAIVGNSLIER